MNAISEQWSVG